MLYLNETHESLTIGTCPMYVKTPQLGSSQVCAISRGGKAFLVSDCSCCLLRTVKVSVSCYDEESGVHLQFVGKGWERALTQLHTCTCAWTIMRKTGLRVVKHEGLPKVCMQNPNDLIYP